MVRRTLICSCFLLSGATALAYEVVWMRDLTLIFGATVLGAGTVMASYMAGLALGSRYWGRRADRCERPLALYARLEIGIALSAAATPLLFALVRWLHTLLFANVMGDFHLLSAARVLLCFPALVVPTFMMGGTLPVLVRYFTAAPDRMGRGAGALYAVNTIGATVGTLVTGFVLIEHLGVKGTLWSAATVNLSVALLALVLARGEQPQRSGWTQEPPDPPTNAPAAATPAYRAVLWGFGLSGMAAMVYEVAWTRAFVLVFGNSTYAFTTMLAAFLVGLALGAALAGRVVDRANLRYSGFALLQVLVALWAAAATPLIEYLPQVFLSTYARSGGAFAALQVLQFAACCLLLLPTTLALGALFPLVSRMAADMSDGAGRSAGLPYAANTLGTVVGSLLAGFVLLPRLGIERSIALAAVVNLGVACWVHVRSSERLVTRPALVGLGALSLVVLARLTLVGLDPAVMSAGTYMYADYFLGAQARNVPLSAVYRDKKVMFYREGYGSSVSVFKLSSGDVTLQANGKTDASTGDLSTQRIVAHLPLLLRPKPDNVLVVGLASGCSTGSVLLHPVRRVQCIEIEPAMLPAARFFDQWNHRCLDDGRMNLLLADARNYVLMARERFGLITSEPTNPWIAGVNNLFTREYYADCARRLKPGGVMCQWLPAYNLNTAEMRTALATFASVFPDATLWVFPKLRTDFLVIGSCDGVRPDPLTVASSLTGAVAEDARQVGIDSLWTLFGGLVLDREQLADFSQGAPLNTDERPLLEFTTPRHLHEKYLAGYTVSDTYRAGTPSRLPLEPATARQLLTQLGLRLPSGATLDEAALYPHHPDDLSTGRPEVDTAELRLKLRVADGAATLRVAQPTRSPWPDSMRRQFLAEPGTGQRGDELCARANLPARGLTVQVEAADAGVAARLLADISM